MGSDLKKHTKKNSRMWCAIGLLFCLILFFAPTLTSLGWHILHGNQVIFRNRIVPVPTGWVVTPQSWATGKDRDLTLIRLPRTLSVNNQPNRIGVMEFDQWKYTNVPPERIPALWVRALEIEAKTSQTPLIGPFNVGESSRRTHCAKRAITASPEGMDISCLLFDAKWSAHFIGPALEAEVFLDVVRRIQ